MIKAVRRQLSCPIVIPIVAEHKAIFSILISVSISTIANSQEATKEQWVSAMKTIMPAHFCQETQYFRECFNVTATECESTAASTTRICLSEFYNQLPNVFTDPKEGSLWGTKVGSCAGIAYESSLIKKRISNKKCDDVNNWK